MPEASLTMSSQLDDMFAEYPLHLSIDQVADLLGISRGTVYKWLKDGSIPGYRIGTGVGTWLILRDELKQAVAEGRPGPLESP